MGLFTLLQLILLSAYWKQVFLLAWQIVQNRGKQCKAPEQKPSKTLLKQWISLYWLTSIISNHAAKMHHCKLWYTTVEQRDTVIIYSMLLPIKFDVGILIITIVPLICVKMVTDATSQPVPKVTTVYCLFCLEKTQKEFTDDSCTPFSCFAILKRSLTELYTLCIFCRLCDSTKQPVFDSLSSTHK